MFEDILKAIIWSLLPHKHAYSIKIGRFIRHFDRYGNPKGYTIIGFFGVRKRFDMNHNLVSVSYRDFWGGYKTYDAQGNLISRSYRNPFGGFTTYNRAGKKIKKTIKAFWDDYNRFDAENPDDLEITVHIEPEHKLKNRSPREKAFASMEFTKESNYYDMLASIEKKDTSGFKAKSDASIKSVKESEKKISNATERKEVVEREKVQSTGITSEKASVSKVKHEMDNKNAKEERVGVSEKTAGYCGSGNGKSSVLKNNAMKSEKDIALEAEKKYEELSELLRHKIDSSIAYYDSVKECEEVKKEKCTKILAFSYQGSKDFPACVSEKNGKLLVQPLVKGAKAIEIHKEEIMTANKRVVKGIDMAVVDNEFAALGASKLIGEFEELFPDYIFAADGMERVQYELKSGLILTENSWIKLKEKYCK